MGGWAIEHKWLDGRNVQWSGEGCSRKGRHMIEGVELEAWAMG